ncbi:PAS domain S-box protein [Kitasatospora sp. MBT63]|uniref:PAS domain S-box protein n=1 Tax=Kitasatospora sp. MBT63 TaxID=1444768 RepID=UPI0011EA69B8
MPDALVGEDSAHRIVLVNHQAEKLLGHREAELLGKGVDELVPQSLREVHRQHRQGSRWRRRPGRRGPAGTCRRCAATGPRSRRRSH